MVARPATRILFMSGYAEPPIPTTCCSRSPSRPTRSPERSPTSCTTRRSPVDKPGRSPVRRLTFSTVADKVVARCNSPPEAPDGRVADALPLAGRQAVGGGAVVRLRRGVGLSLPRAREGQAQPRRPRGAPLRSARRRRSHLAHARPAPPAGELLHPGLDGRQPPAAVPAHSRRGPRDRRPRQRPRGGRRAGSGAGEGRAGRAAADSRRISWACARPVTARPPGT